MILIKIFRTKVESIIPRMIIIVFMFDNFVFIKIISKKMSLLSMITQNLFDIKKLLDII